jgi:disulfide bond formation protein DsbB
VSVGARLDGHLCGHRLRVGTSLRVAQARPVTMLLVVIKTGGDTYLVGLVQTVESDNPTYLRDAETILTGFQMLPPASAKPSDAQPPVLGCGY